MHEYSVDVERSKIIFYLAIISVFISTGVTKLLNEFLTVYIPIELKISITTIAVFGLVYGLFNKYFWKLKVFKKLGIVQTPNLNGVWEGSFMSSFYNFNEELPAKLSIEQTWTKICIIGNFNDSNSSSYTTSIKVNDGGGVKVYYSYRNEKKPEKADALFSDHKGYATLVLDKKESRIEGQYFNNPSNNRNHGKLILEKTK